MLIDDILIILFLASFFKLQPLITQEKKVNASCMTFLPTV